MVQRISRLTWQLCQNYLKTFQKKKLFADYHLHVQPFFLLYIPFEEYTVNQKWENTKHYCKNMTDLSENTFYILQNNYLQNASHALYMN